MNTTISKKYFSGRRMIFALAAGILLSANAGAQTAKRYVEGRWLFIFSTAAEMKPRIKATQYEINSLFSTSLSGQLHMNDGIGVWTFDEQLHTGGFPLSQWYPEGAWMLASNMSLFIGKQRYANTTRLNVIAPMLNQVVKNSTRLTVLIFCDGESELNWTPYASGVNQVLQQHKAWQKKAKQPFVLVLRSQAGQYIGCTVNFPPGAVKLLPFPPLPPPTNAAPASLPQPTNKPPVRAAAPLIVVGTKVETNWPPDKPVPANAPPMTVTNATPPAPASLPDSTNSVAPTNAMTQPPPAPLPVQSPPQNPPPTVVSTNAVTSRPPPEIKPEPAKPVVAVETNAAAPPTTNPVTPAIAPAPPAAPTNSAPPPENSGLNRTAAFAIGAAALIIAVVIAAVFIVRARRGDRGSLISRSMRKP